MKSGEINCTAGTAAAHVVVGDREKGGIRTKALRNSPTSAIAFLGHFTRLPFEGDPKNILVLPVGEMARKRRMPAVAVS